MKNTTLCYVEKDGKYLMIHRIKKVNDVNQDKWVGIGGKFEDKESPEDCVLREVSEETEIPEETEESADSVQDAETEEEDVDSPEQ